MCKIKTLGQNTFEKPTGNESGRRPIAREGTNRLLAAFSVPPLKLPWRIKFGTSSAIFISTHLS